MAECDDLRRQLAAATGAFNIVSAELRQVGEERDLARERLAACQAMLEACRAERDEARGVLADLGGRLCAEVERSSLPGPFWRYEE